MFEQYVFTSNQGLFRIVRHGHRWRSLREEHECGRHAMPEDALRQLREDWPQARLPGDLDRWRHLVEHRPPPARRVGAWRRLENNDPGHRRSRGHHDRRQHRRG